MHRNFIALLITSSLFVSFAIGADNANEPASKPAASAPTKPAAAADKIDEAGKAAEIKTATNAPKSDDTKNEAVNANENNGANEQDTQPAPATTPAKGDDAKGDDAKGDDAKVNNKAPNKDDSTKSTETTDKPTDKSAGNTADKTATSTVTKTTAKSDKPKAPATIRFQFDGIPYNDVIRRFAQMANKPILGDVNVEGELTFFDSEPYTYDDALDTLNLMLAMRGSMMMEDGRYLRVVPVSDIPQLPIKTGEEEAANARPGEIVTLVIPVKHIDVETASKAVVPMVSIFGKIAPLPRGKGILITDRLVNIKRIRHLVTMLDNEADEKSKLEMKSYKLKRADARDVSNAINTLVRSSSSSRSSDSRSRDNRSSSGDSVIICTYDQKSNAVLVRGTEDLLKIADDLVQMLDGEEGISSNISVFPLKTAEARDVADALRTAFGGSRERPGPVWTYGDTSMNSVLVKASPAYMKDVKELIEKLDGQVADFNKVRVFRLRNAEAEAVEDVLRAVLSPRSASSANSRTSSSSRGSSYGTVIVQADENTNSLYVSATPERLDMAEKIIADLDKDLLNEERELHIVELEDADAPTLAESLTEMYKQVIGDKSKIPGAMPVIQGIAASNSLIISSSTAQWKQISSLIDDVKQATVSKHAPVTRIVPLKYAKAVEVVETLRQVYSDTTPKPARTSSSSSSSRTSTETKTRTSLVADLGKTTASFAASEHNNSLVIVASEKDQKMIAEVIKSLDIEPTKQVDPIRIVQLKSANAVELAKTLKAMVAAPGKGESKIFVEADPATNAVLIRAPASEQKMLEQMVASIDESTELMARELRLIQLNHISATAMAAMLNQLYAAQDKIPNLKGDAAYYYYRAMARESEGKDKQERVRTGDQQIKIAAAPGDRMLVVEGPANRIDEIEQLIKTMDKEDGPALQEVRTYNLSRSNAVELASSLTKLFAPDKPANNATTPSAEIPPRFEADSGSNQLLVYATAAQYEAIDKIIKEVETKTVLATQTKTFRLKHARAEEVILVLQPILLDTPTTARGQATAAASKEPSKVRIAALSATNDIIVQGPADTLLLAEQLIKTFDDPEAMQNAVLQVVHLKNAQAASLAQAVTAVLEAKASRTVAAAGNNGKPVETVTISAEPNSNSVLVRGPSDQVTAAVEIIKRLDDESTGGTTQMKVYRLKEGNAASLAKSFETLFQSIIAQHAKRQEGITPPPFSVAADEPTNTLVVSTTPGYFTLVEDLIEQLDQKPQRNKRDAEYFWLANADSFDVAMQLDSMFADRQGDQKPVIQSDLYSNAITVIALPDDLKAIGEIVAKIDDAKEKENNSVQVRYVPLKAPVKATKLAEALKKIYEQTSDGKVIITDKIPTEQQKAPEKKNGAPGNAGKAGPAARSSDEPMDMETLAIEIAAANVGDVDVQFVAAEAADTAKSDEKGAARKPTVPDLSNLPAGTDVKTVEVPVGKDGKVPDVTIAVDEATNSLIISGTRAQLDELELLIAQLSGEDVTGENLDFRVYPVRHGDPQVITQILNSLFNPRALQQQNQRNNNGNQVQQLQQQIFQMQQNMMQRMGQFVPGGDNSGDNGRGQRGNRNNQQGGNNNQRSGRNAQQQQQQPTVAIVADRRTSRIIARGKPADLDLIGEVINQLDTSTTLASEVRLFQLKNTNATQVSANLRDMFTPRTTGNTSNPVLIMSKLQQKLKDEGINVEAVDMSSIINIGANEQTNTIIVAAPGAAMQIIGEVVEEIDQAATNVAMPSVRLYPVKNADLATIVANLQQVFAPMMQTRGAGSTQGVGKLVITADASTNNVIVSASPEQHDMIATIIKEMDKVEPGEELIVKVYKVQNADADSVANTLSETLMGGTQGQRVNRRVLQFMRGPTAQGGAVSNTSTPPMRITADGSSNSLVVRATKAEHEEIEKLLKQIDVAVASSQPIQIIAMKHANAERVAEVLTRVFDAGNTRSQNNFANLRLNRFNPNPASNSILIEGDNDSRMLMVRADAETFKKVKDLAEQMDVASPRGMLTQRIIELKNAQASSVAAALTQSFAQPRTIGNIQAGNNTRPQDENERVIIVAEQLANALIVTANEENHKKVASLVEQLDADKAGGMTRQFLVLENVEALQLSQALARIAGNGQSIGNFGSRVGRQNPGNQGGAGQTVVSADTSSNALIFSGPSKEVESLMKMAKDLDVAKTDFDTGIKILPIKNGDAVEMASTIRSLFNQTLLSRGGDLGPGTTTFAISADERANALIIVGDSDMQTQIQFAVNHLELLSPEKGKLRVIPLQHADPNELQRAIYEIYGGNPPVSAQPAGNQGGNFNNNGGNQGGNFNRGNTQPNRSNNNQGGNFNRGNQGGNQNNRGNFNRGGGNQPRRGSMDDTTTRTTRATGRVNATPLPGQRAILVNSNDVDFEDIRKLAEAMDKAAEAKKRQTKVVILKNADNSRIAASLTQMYSAAARSSVEEDRVVLTALAGTNALVIAAVKDKIPEVEALISQLDNKSVSPQLEFRVYPIKNASPTKILPLLQQMLAKVEAVRQDNSLDVQADERTRTIIVTAKSDVFDQVGKVIELLDKAPAHEAAEIMVVQLKRADSTRLATVLADMLRPTAEGQVTPEARALQEQVRKLNIRGDDGKKKIELDLTKPIKITADPIQPGEQGGNALILSSTAENLQGLAALVKMMDQVPLTDAVNVKLVQLENADAGTVAETLTTIFEEGQKLAGKAGTSTEGKAEPKEETGKALVNPLNVAIDARTNTLILSGREETLLLAQKVATDLDKETGKFVTEVRLFTLRHAEATSLMPLLTSVFGESEATGGSAALRTQVSRLKTVLDKQDPRESKTPKIRPALTIQADEATQTLVVAAPTDVMPLIEDVIKTLDVPGAGAGNLVRILPLENADATRIKTVIDSLYTGDNAANLRDVDKPVISVDTRTNALVFSASEKTFMVITALMKQLDRKQPIELKELRLVKLKNAEATALAPVLQKAMDERVQHQESLGVKDAEALRVLVEADARSNSLIIGGSNEGYKLVQSLAQQLDDAGPALTGQIQIFPLKEANAGTLSITLQQLFDQRYAAAATPDVQNQKPTILPDLRTNSLLVASNADDSKVLSGLLTKMDVKLTDPAVGIYVVGMKHNDSGVVGPAVQRLFQARLQANTVQGTTPAPQDQVTIETDSLSNALIISASKENYSLIETLLSKVDIEPPAETGVVRMYALANSDATRVGELLKGLVEEGLYKPGAASATAQQNQAVIAREKIAVGIDTRTNVLIVSASKENFAVIEEIIKKIDSGEDFGVLGDIRMFALNNADATRLAPTLQSFFDAKRAAETAVGGSAAARALNVSITPDARTNTLLVAGSKESFAAVQEMIGKLDVAQVKPASEFRVFELKSATAATLQPTLSELFSQRVARGETKDNVTVLADSRTNSLIVGASGEDMIMVDALIGKLDSKPSRNDSTLKMFPLAKGDATEVADTLRNLWTSQGGTTTGNNGQAGGIGISVDTRLNAIVVSAGKADLTRIEGLIRQLDNSKPTKVTEIRVFTLQHADAEEMSTLLNSVLSNQQSNSTNSDNSGRQTILQFISKENNGQEFVEQAIKEGVMIAPDRRTNSLIVSAPLEYMPLLKRLVNSLDLTSPREAEIHVYTLRNADATQMADVLAALFRMEAVANGAGGANGDTDRAVRYTLISRKLVNADGKVSATNASATIGTAEQDALSLTVDTRTNALLIGGDPTQVALCRQIIEELDESPAQERKTEVYRLRNGQAPDIESALRAFLDQERQRLTQALGEDRLGAAQRLLEREVSLVAEPTSNTILLSASPRYFPVIEGMIKKLDEAKPQVLIQVLLAEVTLDDSTDLGLEWNATAKVAGADVSAGTDFGIEQAFNQFGGLGISVTGGDLSFFLRALQSQGKLEVLSRPQILASDNQPADINVGQRVPFVTNSRISDQGNVVNTIEYQDVGILLNVTARLSDDGFIRLDVAPEISSLSTSSVQVSEAVNAPIINNRSAATTISVQDGHTIVLGGLITTTDEERVNKVPLLGDLPWVGEAFKSTSKRKERTELLIILTPRVIRTAEDADKMTKEQQRQSEMLKKLGLERDADDFVKPLNGNGPLRVPDDQPKNGGNGNGKDGSINLPADRSRSQTQRGNATGPLVTTVDGTGPSTRPLAPPPPQRPVIQVID